MSPERLLKEPWRLGMFFALVFGVMIVCIATILWQQERFGANQLASNQDVRHTQDLVLLALQKSDRNNRTILKVYQAGEKARGQLIQMVAEEKQMNITLLGMNRCLIQMNRRLLASQAWMRLHMKHLEMRRR